MRLREWQHDFQSALLGKISFGEVPLQDQRLSRELSLGIYANAYRERLHEALRGNFPALHRLLGDRDFADMAYAFIAAHPSQTASIRWFGAELSSFLAQTPPFLSLPIFSEIAQFEWALRHTVDAGDAGRIDAAQLQALSDDQWATLRCAWHPSLTLLHCNWNATQVWQALIADEEPPEPAPFASYWLVYRRRDLISEWRSADANEAECLQLWQRGKNFGDICECLAEKIDDADSAVAMAASFMRTWVEQELLTLASDEIEKGVSGHD